MWALFTFCLKSIYCSYHSCWQALEALRDFWQIALLVTANGSNQPFFCKKK